MTWFDNIENWLTIHDGLSQEVTLWVISLGFLACGWVGWRTWWIIRATIDETSTGLALKRKKLAEGIAWTLMAILFSIVLAGIYDLFTANTMSRTGIRFLAGIAVWVVAAFGLLFIHAFEHDAALIHAKVTTDQNDRENLQNQREELQNQRDNDIHEPVNTRQDIREESQNLNEERLAKREDQLST